MRKDKKLYLSDKDKKICGVCGGIAEYFEIDSTIVRLGFLVLGVCTAFLPLIVVYFVAAMVMPEKKD